MPETPLTSKRFRVVDKEAYGIDLEYNGDFVIIHLPWVKTFSRSVYADMVLSFEPFKEFLECMGYARLHAAILPSKESTKKLALRLGFECIGHDSGYDIYEILIGE